MDPRLKLILIGDPEEVVLLLVRLKQPEATAPFCQVITQFGDIITCRVQRKHLLDLYNSPATFSVKAPRLIPAPLQKEAIADNTPGNGTGTSRRFPLPYTGKGIYFAAVDWGFDFAHANLRNRDGTTRFKCIWDQNGIYDGNKYGYGCFYSEEEINEALQTDTPYQTLGMHPGKGDISGMGMHGTHVVDIAAGTPMVGEGGIASEAKIIGVELGNNFVNGSDLALGDSVRLVEALDYIRAATPDAPCVINMSLGSHGDSHTGKSLVEIAFDNFLTQNPGYAICQSVGNYYTAHCHIHYTLQSGETYGIEWHIPRRNPAPDEVEIWYPGTDRFSLRLIAPDGEIVADVEPFEDIQISYHNAPIGYIFQRADEPNTGLNHIDIILDVFILRGKWIIELTGKKVTNGSFHAYCERDDAGQAKFSPHQSSPYTTTGSVCNGQHTIAAGAYNHRIPLRPVLSFSSSGPTVLLLPKPDILAPGYKIVAARSAPFTAYQPTNDLTTKSGSSMANPHVSGCIALLFEKYAPERLSITKTKQLLFQSVDPVPDYFSKADTIRAGHGFLNIPKLLGLKDNDMNATSITRPVRRVPVTAESENFSDEPEMHTPYMHQHCQACEQALLEKIDEDGWKNEPELVSVLNQHYFNGDVFNPFTAYRHFHPRYTFTHNPYQHQFAVVALPDKRLRDELRVGDILLMRSILSGKTTQAIITDPEPVPHMEVRGYSANTKKLGYYVQAYGNGSGNENERMYFRITNRDGVVLDNIVVIRKRVPGNLSSGNGYTRITEQESSNMPLRKLPDRGGTAEKEVGHDDVKGRVKWFLESRFGKELGPSDRQLVAYADASENIKLLKQDEVQELEEDLSEETPKVGKNNWVPLGPSVIRHGQASKNPDVSGRVTSIATGPSGQRIYIGTANGGVWFSGNEGGTWEALDAYAVSATNAPIEADSLSIGAIAVKFGSKRKEDIIYVGTGEALAEGIRRPDWPISAIHYFGVGIKYSKDGGAHWQLEGKNLRGVAIYKITIDPSDADKAFAATSSGIFRRKISGGNAVWEQVEATAFTDSNPNAKTAVTDFIITGSGAGKKYYAAFAINKVYQGTLTAGGAISWTPVGGYTFSGRKALAASESNPNILYVFDANNDLYRLDTSVAGASFQQVSPGTVPPVFNSGQGYYDIILAVDPSDADTVYMAGDWVYDGTPPQTNAELYTLSLFKGKIKNTAGSLSCSFNTANAANPASDPTYIGTGVHADGHAIAFALDATGAKQDPKKIWIGCDGGLFYSNSAGNKGSFSAKNKGLAITQMTYIAQHPDTPSVLFCGCQDNGTLRHLAETEWQRGEGYGDGGGVAIDPNNMLHLISQSYKTGYFKNTDGGQSKWVNIPLPTFPINFAQEQRDTRFYSPMDSFFDAAGKQTMVVLGTSRLWLSLSTDTATWGTKWQSLPNNVDPYSTVPPSSADYLGAPITSVKIASSSKIYATTESDIFRYDLAGGTWSITPLPRIGFTVGKYFITSIDVDPTDTDNFYIALGGPGSFERCYYFNKSSTPKWHAVGPPKTKLNIPCHAVAADPEHPGTVYLGSDVGVWKLTRIKNQFKWDYEQYSYSLPEAAVTDLAIHKKGRLLRVATHGRGIWEIALDQTHSQAVQLYLKMNKADNGRIDPRTKKRFDWNITGKGFPDPDSPGKYLSEKFDSPDIEVGSIKLNVSTVVRVYVHNRGWRPINSKKVRVCLLMAEASGGVIPNLPNHFETHINNGDKNWLAGSNWMYADPSQPYSNLSDDLPPYATQEALFSPDYSQINLATPGLHTICFAALVTTTDRTDPLTGTDTDLNLLVMNDNHVAYKKVLVI